ncbi:MAG: amidohydrolase family protein [Paludibacteraceae bacterium]|nr:amidohydrolase family protein [Paludibacteraceae bacterium]
MNIYRANIIHTPTPNAFEICPKAYICVGDDGCVEGIYEQLPSCYSASQVTDFGDHLLIPAFCDMHVHAPQYRNMGVAMDEELLQWLNKYTFPEEIRFAEMEHAQRMYSRFVHELWMQGTMRSAVFATSHIPATLVLADMFLQSGMGAYIGLVGMNRNCPQPLICDTEQHLAGLQTLMQYLHDRQKDEINPLCKPIVTPRFIPSCTPDMLEQLGRMAQQYNLPVQSHLSENMAEIEWVKELEPDVPTYAHAYHKYGLFGQTPTLMAHCCYTDGEEKELMRQSNVIAVHCPTSNSNLASGIAPIKQLLQANIPVALGTDVSGGNNLSVLRTIQYAIQLSKLQYAQYKRTVPFISLSEAFYMATKAGGSFFGNVGAFLKGYEFDALVVNDQYLNHDNYSLLHRIERYVYLGDDRDIVVRFCRGKEISKPRRL